MQSSTLSPAYSALICRPHGASMSPPPPLPGEAGAPPWQGRWVKALGPSDSSPVACQKARERRRMISVAGRAAHFKGKAAAGEGRAPAMAKE